MLNRATVPGFLGSRLGWMLGWLWLAFSAAVTVIYRAYAQSLTVDEAYVFHDYLNQSASILFQQYNASHHLLHTAVQWISVHIFGTSEFAIRLPSVLGGLGYLAGVAVLCRHLLGDGWKWLCGVLLLTANPHIADYLSAGRGYGSALAFYVWALNALLDRSERRAGVLLGLSVACNLTFVFPAAASGAIFVALEIARGATLASLVKRLGIPFLLVAAPILALPLWHARMATFYFGAPDLGSSITSLMLPSVLYSGDPRPEWLRLTEIIAGFTLLAALIFASITAARRRQTGLLLVGGSLVASLTILIVAHGVLGVLYPESRTGLYLTWLFLTSCLAVWGGAVKWLSVPFAAVSVFFAALFLVQFNTHYYYDFRSDAEMKDIMLLLNQQPRAGKACVGGSWAFEHTMLYYRLRYGMDWLEPMTRTEKPEPGCGYFILDGGDFPYVKKLGLRSVWMGPVSFTTLAVAP